MKATGFSISREVLIRELGIFRSVMAAMGDLTLDGRTGRRQVTRAGSTVSYDVLSLDNANFSNI